jgi:CRP-like cAMP-binding protein
VSAAELGQAGLFSDLGPSELALLASVADAQALRAGELLCLEGSEADGAIVLLEGALECTREGAGELGRIEAPALLGMASLAFNGNREATLKAVGAARVLLLTRNGFHRFSQDAPSAALRVLESVVRDLALALQGSIAALLPPRG